MMRWKIFLLSLYFFLTACQKVEVNKVQENLSQAAEYNAELGLSYLSENQLEVAQEKLALATTQDPANLYVLLAEAYFFQKTRREAIADQFYQKALQTFPQNTEVLNNYGAYLCHLGRYREGIHYLTLAQADIYYAHPKTISENLKICRALLQGV